MHLEWELQPDNRGGEDGEYYHTKVIFQGHEWRSFMKLQARLTQEQEALAAQAINYQIGEFSVLISQCIWYPEVQRFMNLGNQLEIRKSPPHAGRIKREEVEVATGEYL